MPALAMWCRASCAGRYNVFQTLEIFLNFIVTGLIVTLYLITGFLPFGWSQPLMAVITDRIAIFGRILMVISLPALTGFLAQKRNRQDIVNESIQD